MRLALLLFTALVQPASATPILTGDFPSNLLYFDTVGYTFKVGESDLQVSALGLRGSWGPVTTNRVGLWTAGGDLLASATFPEGILQAGSPPEFFWAPITTDITLSSGHTYVLGAVNIPNWRNSWETRALIQYIETYSFLVSPHVTITGGARSLMVGTSPDEDLRFPSVFDPWMNVLVGPNLDFAVIERPSHVPDDASGAAMLGFTLMCLVAITLPNAASTLHKAAHRAHAAQTRLL